MNLIRARQLIGIFAVFGLCQTASAEVYTDLFDTSRNYLTEGVSGTIWDGFIGLEAGQTVSALNASSSRPGQLYMASANAYYGPPWNPLGPFLYKTVTGNFIASVKVTAYQNVYHNTCGIMARASLNPDLAGSGEDWVSIDYFPIWNCGNFVRMANDGAREELCHNGLARNAGPWLQLEKKGAVFHFRWSADGTNWTEMSCSPIRRPDLRDVPLQVGLFQCTFSTDLGYAAFDQFSLTVTEPEEEEPSAWTYPALTLEPETRLVDHSSGSGEGPAFMLGAWDTDGSLDGWTVSGLTDVNIEEGILCATASADKPYLERTAVANGPDLDFGYFDYLQFRLKLPEGRRDDIILYYGHTNAPLINTGSTRNLVIPADVIPTDGQWHTYRLDLGLAVWWRDRLTDLRIYPLGTSGGDGQSFQMDYIEVGDLAGDVLLVNTDLNIYSGESFSNLQSMESKHAVFWWSPQSYQRYASFNPEQMGRRALRMIEESYQVYCKNLHYDEPFESFELWRRNGNRYKINHITWYDGFWCGGWNGFMHIGINGSGLLDEGWGNPVPHEFGHYVQGHQLGNLDGGHWESHANFLRHNRNVHYAEMLISLGDTLSDRIFDVTNFRQDHGSLIYQDYRIHHVLRDFGAEAGLPDAAADVWKKGSAGQTIYNKLAGLLPAGSDIGSFIAGGLRHWPFLDFSDGQIMQGIFWNGEQKEALFKYKIGSHLIPCQDAPGWYRVPFERAPERFAYMLHLLTPQSSEIHAAVRGLDIAGSTEDWRWSLAAADENWRNVRYSDVFRPGPEVFQLEPGETKLFLIVTATPTDTKLNLEWTDNSLPIDKHPDRLRYGYEVYLEGAVPALAERRYSSAIPEGAAHSNGGGFVAKTAAVSSTAYVGPNARVLGTARVLNTARIENFAVVTDSATVQNSAIVSGHSLIMGGSVIRDNARIRDRAIVSNSTVRGKARVEGYAGVYDGAIVSDYAIVQGCSTISGGTISGTGIAAYDYSGGTLSDGVHFSHVPWGDWYQDYWWNTLRKPRGLTASYRIEESEGEVCWDEFGAQPALLRGRPLRVYDTASNSAVLRLNGANQYIVLNRSVCDAVEGSFGLRICPVDNRNQPLVFMGASESKFLELRLNSQAKAEFTITTGTAAAVLTSLSEIPAGSWTSLAVTLSGSECILYVNGQAEDQTVSNLVSEQVLGPNNYTAVEAFYVGRNWAGELYRGLADDIRFYNTALTAAEIANEIRRSGRWLAAMFFDSEMDFDGAATKVESGVRNGLKRRLLAEIYPRSSDSVPYYEGIFDSNDERSSRHGSGIGLNNGLFYVCLDGAGLWNTQVPVSLNQWQTVRLDFDGSHAWFYVNGILRANRAYSANPDALAAKNYRIGFAMNDNGEYFYFDGKIRNLRVVDLGDSAPTLTPGPDINRDQCIDLLDLAELTAGWLEKDCSSSNQWCCLLDLDMSGTVDLNDFSILAENW